MENIDYSKTIPSGVSSMIAFGIVVVLTMLVIVAVMVIRKWKGRIFPLFAGLMAYVVFVFLLCNMALSIILRLPQVNQAMANNSILYSILVCVIFSLFYMLARIVLCKIFVGRYDRKGDIAASGVGIVAGDCIYYVITMISYSIWCSIIQSEGLEKALETVESGSIAATYDAVSILFDGHIAIWAVIAFSYILDILVNVVFMCMVFGVVTKQLKPYWYAIIFAANLAVSISFQNYDMTSLNSILISFGIKLIICSVIICYAIKVKDKEIVYNND